MNFIISLNLLLQIFFSSSIKSAAVSLNGLFFETLNLTDEFLKFDEKNETSAVFVPLEIEKESAGNFFYDYDSDLDTSMVPLPSTEPQETINREMIYDFVQYFLQVTMPYQNTIEVVDTSDVTVHSKSSSHDHLWRKKKHVCVSNVAKKYIVDTNDVAFNYEHRCKTKADSEMCMTEIKAGDRKAKITLTDMCCPNFHLDDKLEECVPFNDSINLYDKLSGNMEEIQTELTSLYPAFKETHFYAKFSEFLDKLTNSKYDTNMNTKLTIYLWDNQAMLNYIRNQNLLDKSEKSLEKIFATLFNHISEFHHPTQSIIQGSRSVINTLSNGHLRLSTFDVFQKSHEFVNCHKIVLKNRYYKHVPYDSNYNYRLLIHQLENSSLLVRDEETAYQILSRQILNKTSSDPSSDFAIFSQIFSKSNQNFIDKLNDTQNSVTVFLPTDQAFSNMRKDQLQSIIEDNICNNQFISKFIVSDEICSQKIFDFNAEYSSSFQSASLITVVDEFEQKQAYFNGQHVSNKTVPFSASNGMFYYLDTIQTSYFLDFLYDMVLYLKKKSNIDFFDRLKTDWEFDLLNESFNTTIILPVSASSSPYQNLFLTNSTENEENDIEITDYLFKGQFQVHELSDGQILTTVSRKKYLINTKHHFSKIPSFLKWVPVRNFFIRSINCQKIEQADLKGCSSQIMFFNNNKLTVPELDTMSVIDYFATDETISIFYDYFKKCGNSCRKIYEQIENDTLPNREERPSKGFTLFIPTNDFFKRYQEETDIFANAPHFENSIKQSIYYGTWCEFFILNNEIEIQNLAGNLTSTSSLAQHIETYQKYFSENSILVHTIRPIGTN